MKIQCVDCHQETNHEALQSHTERLTQDERPEMSVEWAEGRWEILKCRGCDDITFRVVWTSSDDIDDDGKRVEFSQLFPPRGKNVLVEKPFINAPLVVRRIYREVLAAFNNDSTLLCGAGIRMLVEATSSELGVTDGLVPRRDQSRAILRDGSGSPLTDRRNNLEGKIYGLAEKGHLTAAHAEVLHGHRFLGNDAVHDFRAGDTDALKAAIEIIEHTLEHLFEIPLRARMLAGRRAV